MLQVKVSNKPKNQRFSQWQGLKPIDGREGGKPLDGCRVAGPGPRGPSREDQRGDMAVQP